ncbi:MAG: tRNA uridine-5-carboxymethylaminomethyl(34) synthesis GTPase MnmE, partial [Anaerolineae bacterium]
MYSLDDTIAAISTPLGEGGIGIVRMSGPDSVAILNKIFCRAKGERLESHLLHYGHIIDPHTEEEV